MIGPHTPLCDIISISLYLSTRVLSLPADPVQSINHAGIDQIPSIVNILGCFRFAFSVSPLDIYGFDWQLGFPPIPIVSELIENFFLFLISHYLVFSISLHFIGLIHSFSRAFNSPLWHIYFKIPYQNTLQSRHRKQKQICPIHRKSFQSVTERNLHHRKVVTRNLILLVTIIYRQPNQLLLFITN